MQVGDLGMDFEEWFVPTEHDGLCPCTQIRGDGHSIMMAEYTFTTRTKRTLSLRLYLDVHVY